MAPYLERTLQFLGHTRHSTWAFYVCSGEYRYYLWPISRRCGVTRVLTGHDVVTIDYRGGIMQVKGRVEQLHLKFTPHSGCVLSSLFKLHVLGSGDRLFDRLKTFESILGLFLDRLNVYGTICILCWTTCQENCRIPSPHFCLIQAWSPLWDVINICCRTSWLHMFVDHEFHMSNILLMKVHTPFYENSGFIMMCIEEAGYQIKSCVNPKN